MSKYPIAEYTNCGKLETKLKSLFYRPERFYAMKSRPGTYYVTVFEDVGTGTIIGAATLVVELKFIHGCNQVRNPSFEYEFCPCIK